MDVIFVFLKFVNKSKKSPNINWLVFKVQKLENLNYFSGVGGSNYSHEQPRLCIPTFQMHSIVYFFQNNVPAILIIQDVRS